MSRIRPRMPGRGEQGGRPALVGRRDQQQLLGTALRRQHTQPPSSWLPIPIRRQAGATSSVPSAGRAGNSWVNSADPTTPVPTRARTPVVVASYATTASGLGSGVIGVPIAAAMSVSAAARTCSVGERVTLGPSSPVSSAWTREGSSMSRRTAASHWVGWSWSSRSEQTVTVTSVHPAASTTLDQVVGRAGVGHLDHEVVGHAAEVGVDLQGEDVHARIAEAAGERREGAGGVGQSCPDPEEHVARLTDRCSRTASAV